MRMGGIKGDHVRIVVSIVFALYRQKAEVFNGFDKAKGPRKIIVTD